jgi:hypothetical protein
LEGSKRELVSVLTSRQESALQTSKAKIWLSKRQAVGQSSGAAESGLVVAGVRQAQLPSHHG